MEVCRGWMLLSEPPATRCNSHELKPLEGNCDLWYWAIKMKLTWPVMTPSCVETWNLLPHLFLSHFIHSFHLFSFGPSPLSPSFFPTVSLLFLFFHIFFFLSELFILSTTTISLFPFFLTLFYSFPIYFFPSSSSLAPFIPSSLLLPYVRSFFTVSSSSSLSFISSTCLLSQPFLPASPHLCCPPLMSSLLFASLLPSFSFFSPCPPPPLGSVVLSCCPGTRGFGNVTIDVTRHSTHSHARPSVIGDLIHTHRHAIATYTSTQRRAHVKGTESTYKQSPYINKVTDAWTCFVTHSHSQNGCVFMQPWTDSE